MIGGDPMNIVPMVTDSSSQASSPMSITAMFTDTRCYDLMPMSRKGIVFETSISFQLAFFSLIEHDTEVAPLWDPEKKTFIGMMTIADYIYALQVCRSQGVSMLELASRTISDMLVSPAMQFTHPDYNTVDAEDSVQQLCLLMYKLNSDYVPIVDPEDGSLVSILGYIDVVHFLDQCAKQHTQMFSDFIGSIYMGNIQVSLTAPITAMLADVIAAIKQNNLLGLPVVDEFGKVVGMYHANQVSFIIKAVDPDAVMDNLNRLTVGDALLLEKQVVSEGLSSIAHPFVSCTLEDKMHAVIDLMMSNRTPIVVCIDDKGSCVTTVTIKDILRWLTNR